MEPLHEQWQKLKEHIEKERVLSDFPERLRQYYPYLRTSCKNKVTRFVLKQQNEEAFRAIKNERPALAPSPVHKIKDWVEEDCLKPVRFLLKHEGYLKRCFDREVPQKQWRLLINTLKAQRRSDSIELVKRCFKHGYPERELTVDWHVCLKKGLKKNKPQLVETSMDHLDEYSDELLESALYNAQQESLEVLLDELAPERFLDGSFRLRRRLGQTAKEHEVVRDFVSGTEAAVAIVDRLLDNKQLTREGPVGLLNELLPEMTDEQVRKTGPVLFTYYPCGLDEDYLQEAQRREVLDRGLRGRIWNALLNSRRIGIGNDVERLQRMYEHGFAARDRKALDNPPPLEPLAENPEALDVVLRRDELDSEALQPIFERATHYRPSMRQLVERHEARPDELKPVLDRAFTEENQMVDYICDEVWDQKSVAPLYQSIYEQFQSQMPEDEETKRALRLLGHLIRQGQGPEDLHELYDNLTGFLRSNPAIPGDDQCIIELLYSHDLHPPESYLRQLQGTKRDFIEDLINKLPRRAKNALEL